MGAPSKRAKRVRKAAEFSLLDLVGPILPPPERTTIYAWDLERVLCAREAQAAGRFRLAAQLADAMRTDDGLFTAYQNRLAPQRGLPFVLEAPNATAKAQKVCAEAEGLFGPNGVAISPACKADVHGDLANHGVAFVCLLATPRDNGSRIDFEAQYWPIEFVRWSPHERCFKTAIADGWETTITHGDGRWIVFSKHSWEPWKGDAAILPASLVWARRAHAWRDWSRGATTHGNAKVIGELPEGIAIGDEEGAAFKRLLQYIASVDSPYGIKPFGSKIEYITNNSQAWQIFKELANASTVSADKIYLGQDGTSENAGGNYIKSERLFGVRNDIVEGDLRALERGFNTGLIEPWAALNFGDSSLAPRIVYKLPDADDDARREEISKRQKELNETIAAYKANGFAIDQAFVDTLATQLGIQAPRLAQQTNAGADFFQYDIELGIVTINEARARKGLAPLPGGERTLPQILDAQEAAIATAANQGPREGDPTLKPPALTNGAHHPAQG